MIVLLLILAWTLALLLVVALCAMAGRGDRAQERDAALAAALPGGVHEPSVARPDVYGPRDVPDDRDARERADSAQRVRRGARSLAV
jgi:hypothetical protein